MTRIRHGRPADRAALCGIQQSVLAEPWPDLLETALSGPPPLYVVEREGADSEREGVDSERDGAQTATVVGYVIVVGAGGVAYVPELAVHSQWQGQGYGSELLSALFDILDDEGYSEVRLTVRVSDGRARGFYASHGFEERERFDGQFEDGDGLLLACTL